MKLFTVLFLAGFVFTASAGAFQNQPEYLPGKIIIKLDREERLLQKAQDTGVHPRLLVQNIMEEHGIARFQPVFGESAQIAVKRTLSRRNITTPAGEVVDDLSRTFYIDYTSPVDPLILSAKLSGIPGVVYAEPHFVYYLLDEPNDPLFGTPGQNFFEYQNFVDAWGVSQSSTNVVIAIIDSGVFYNHPDLQNKLWTNPEPGRAREFSPQLFGEVVDDTIGWNFWESGDVPAGMDPVQNNDPIARWSIHGTHVAGIAAAETDNEIGIAGTGYNASYMAVKTGGTEQYPRRVDFGIVGILYAAVNEADIINTSFGGPNFSQFGEDVVNTATELGSLVVSSAGNQATGLPFYPASYQNALSVGSVDTPANNQQDIVSSFSSFGFNVDVFATGRQIRSTAFEYEADNDEENWIYEPDSLGYVFATGTSMSAPVVSGLAALIKHLNPEWGPRRLAYQIRNTARPINGTQAGEYQLGRGVIDAFRAVTDDMPGLEITGIQFLNQEGNSLNVGEEGFAVISIINHGAAVNPLASIISLTDNVTTEPDPKNLGSIPTGQTQTFELAIAIGEDFNLEENPVFVVEFEDPNQNYEDFSVQEYEDFLFENVQTNALTMSVLNDGTIGFLNALMQSGGVGFIPAFGDTSNQLFEGGIMIHAVLDDTAYVPNQVRFEDEITRDFSPVRNVGFRDPELSDMETIAVFNSSNHPEADELNVQMETFAFEDEALNQTVFIRYTVTNSGSRSYNDVHVGLFNDWDVGNFITNYVSFSEQDSLIYAFDGANDDQPYVAVAHMGVISSAFAIDNTSEMSLGRAETREDSLSFGIYYDPANPPFDGFTPAEKQLALTAGLEQTTMTSTDISIVTGTGPFLLEEKGTVSVGFIYAWGSDLNDLQSQVANARELNLFSVSPPGIYRDGEPVIIPETTRLYQNFPNPFRYSTTIQYDLADPAQVELTIYNVLGQRIANLVSDMQNEGQHSETFNAQNLASGLYLAVLQVDDVLHTIKMSLVK